MRKKIIVKSQIWTPLDPLCLQYWEGSSADIPPKIWNVMTPYVKTLFEQKTEN